MTHEDYVSFEQAKALKEFGFDWEYRRWYFNLTKEIVWVCIHDCFDYENMTQAPSLAQAQKWLREVKGKIIIPCVMHIENIMKYDFYIADEPLDVEYDFEGFDTYEQALSAGIDRALELLKD